MSTEFDPLLHYIELHSTEEDELLFNLNRETHLEVVNPRMLSGAVQGRFLEFISRMCHPENILEIGTFTGYSAICLARGLKSGGKLITIENNDELETKILDYFRKAELEDKIELKIGNALEIIPKLDTTFDLIFIDAEKTEYLNYYQLVIDKVDPGGFIIVDNVLWDKKVIDENCKSNPETKAIIEFNDFVQADKRVENIILSVRDGISLIRRI